MTSNGAKNEQVQAIRDGLDLSQLLFGDHAGGQAIVRAFEQEIADCITTMLQAESVEQLTAAQNQAVGILKGLQRMGGNMQQVRTLAAEKASRRVVRTALNLHETLEERS